MGSKATHDVKGIITVVTVTIDVAMTTTTASPLTAVFSVIGRVHAYRLPQSRLAG